jgi:hypothetical protein
VAISHGQPGTLPDRASWLRRVAVPEMWAALTIVVIWLAVLFDALWGPDFVSTTAGGNNTTIPSAIILVVFAYLATRQIAKYGFGHHAPTE